MDLTPLIRGLLVVIGISLVLGKYGALQNFARREAAASLRGWGSHAFFPRECQRRMRAPVQNGSHVRETPRTGAAGSRPDQFNSKKY